MVHIQVFFLFSFVDFLIYLWSIDLDLGTILIVIFLIHFSVLSSSLPFVILAL